ncbi:hypothetical protein R5R35_001109 [Gryllus longicercus]|uniref:Peroxisomal ATPase PEX1 n=1 Tax=Gryllus longicercus TaxID=2509291 RepID=A0AAN9W1C3_9ORTH
MKEEPFVVKYLTARNCYLHFSDYWSKRLSNLGALTSALRVDYKNGKHAFFSWNPQFLNADDDSVVCVSATYAQKLGIDDGEKVTITFHNHVASVSRVVVSPLTTDDFEILAMNQDLLQSGLLDQIQIVWPGQTFVAWVGTSMHAVLNVDSVEPKSQIGRLQTLTEIIINSPSEKLAQGDILAADVQDEIKNEEQSATTEEEDREEDSYLPKTSSVVSFIWDSVQGISSRLWGKEEYEKDISRRSEHSVTNLLSEKLKLLEPLVYRVHPFQFADESKISSQFLHPYNAYIHKTNLLIPLLCARQSLVVKLVPVSFVSKSNTPGTEEEKKVNEKEKFLKLNSSDSVYVKLCIIDDLLNKTDEEMNQEINRVFDSGGQHCIFLPSAVRAALHVKTGARVRLEVDGTPYQQPVSLELMTIGRTCSPKDTESIWKKYMLQLCGESDILINSNSIVPVLSSDNTIHHMSVKILDPSVPYCLLTKSSLEKSKIKIGLSKSLGVSVPVTEDENFHPHEVYHCFSHLEKQITLGMTNIEITLGLTSVPWSLQETSMSVANVLLRGKSGSGVSTLARHLCNKFRGPPWYVHCVEIQCRNIKGKKVENLLRLFSQALGECSLHQPSILLLQDLDVLAATASPDQEAAQEGRYYTRVGEMLVELLQDYQPTFRIAVLATAASSGKLNSTLMAARGQHTFLSVLDVPELNKDDRLKILEKLLESKVSLKQTQIDLDSFAKKSDGYVVQDLVDFMEKAVFEAWKRKALAEDFSEGDPALQNEDLEKAFQVMKPLALRGVELVQDAGLCWADIGGLSDAKKLLVEMLEWPVQFPELFSQAPLRLQSGLLLYGAPGTGKTLLAGAVAKECGLNFISVKGPELLSKYIGASEEAVRTIFQKAQSAKPCVLFFDEFDSLAPRRGHDSTGVTDRVVNQLLTQLDGVEALDSVWVLAATSRPDLLDPALLRPGRLDSAVLCPLPTKEDRVAILQSLSRKLFLAEDVDLSSVAEKTEGFTGADLQAILYSAQLAAVEEISPLENSFLNKNLVPEEPPQLEMLYIKDKNVKGPIRITQSLLLAALKDTRPSLNEKEQQKYKRIYEHFEKSRSSSSKGKKSISTTTTPPPLQQKVTLA